MCIKNTKLGKADEECTLLDAIRSCDPVAKESLSRVYMKCAKNWCKACRSGKGHPAWIFACREGGKRRCLYVRKHDVPAVEAAWSAADSWSPCCLGRECA